MNLHAWVWSKFLFLDCIIWYVLLRIKSFGYMLNSLVLSWLPKYRLVTLFLIPIIMLSTIFHELLPKCTDRLSPACWVADLDSFTFWIIFSWSFFVRFCCVVILCSALSFSGVWCSCSCWCYWCWGCSYCYSSANFVYGMMKLCTYFPDWLLYYLGVYATDVISDPYEKDVH